MIPPPGTNAGQVRNDSASSPSNEAAFNLSSAISAPAYDANDVPVNCEQDDRRTIDTSPNDYSTTPTNDGAPTEEAASAPAPAPSATDTGAAPALLTLSGDSHQEPTEHGTGGDGQLKDS